MKILSLSEIWRQQKEYNDKVKAKSPRDNSSWMMDYILGTMRELGELLEQLSWKAHRSNDGIVFGPNTIEELTDVTKYVFSMWQLLDKSPFDMLQAMDHKGMILDQLLRQELGVPLYNRHIIMLDLDGCIADFREGFLDWVFTSKWKNDLTTESEDLGLHLDIDHKWKYSVYNMAKKEFEEQGGYKDLPPISWIIRVINECHRRGWYIIVHTARPYSVYKRIWIDTWSWLKNNEVMVDELHFGYETRIDMAAELSISNVIVAIEDDPTLIRRYIVGNIPVITCDQPYNKHLNKHIRYMCFDDDTDPADAIEMIDCLRNLEEEITDESARS